MRVRAIADYRPDDSTHLSFSFGETLELHLETGGTDASYLKATTLGGPEGGKASGLVPAVSAGLIAMEGPRACMVATFTAEHEGERMSDGSQSTRARSCCPRAFIDAPHACQHGSSSFTAHVCLSCPCNAVTAHEDDKIHLLYGPEGGKRSALKRFSSALTFLSSSNLLPLSISHLLTSHLPPPTSYNQATHRTDGYLSPWTKKSVSCRAPMWRRRRRRRRRCTWRWRGMRIVFRARDRKA